MWGGCRGGGMVQGCAGAAIPCQPVSLPGYPWPLLLHYPPPPPHIPSPPPPSSPDPLSCHSLTAATTSRCCASSPTRSRSPRCSSWWGAPSRAPCGSPGCTSAPRETWWRRWVGVVGGWVGGWWVDGVGWEQRPAPFQGDLWAPCTAAHGCTRQPPSRAALTAPPGPFPPLLPPLPPHPPPWRAGLPRSASWSVHAHPTHAPLLMNFLLSTLRDWNVRLLPMAAERGGGRR